jgi:hypothetical protein
MKCDFEYEMIGSKERTCLPSGKWNGTKTICEGKKVALGRRNVCRPMPQL